jgi:hypothetical protein
MLLYGDILLIVRRSIRQSTTKVEGPGLDKYGFVQRPQIIANQSTHFFPRGTSACLTSVQGDMTALFALLHGRRDCCFL